MPTISVDYPITNDSITCAKNGDKLQPRSSRDYSTMPSMLSWIWPGFSLRTLDYLLTGKSGPVGLHQLTPVTELVYHFLDNRNLLETAESTQWERVSAQPSICFYWGRTVYALSWQDQNTHSDDDVYSYLDIGQRTKSIIIISDSLSRSQSICQEGTAFTEKSECRGRGFSNQFELLYKHLLAFCREHNIYIYYYNRGLRPLK